MFQGGLWKDFASEKPLLSVEGSLRGLFCGSLEDKSVEGNVEDGSLACEVSEGRLKALSGLFAVLI